MTIHTFKRFWETYHRKMKIKKTYKDVSLELWNKTINISQRKKAFDNIDKFKAMRLNAYDYLKVVLYDFMPHNTSKK